jgi:hypothetical protein
MDDTMSDSQQLETLGFAQPVGGGAYCRRDVGYFLWRICFIDK